MSSFELADPLKLAGQLVDGQLQGAATGLQLASASLDAPFNAGIPGVGFGASAGAVLSLCAYGDGGAMDPDGVVGRPLPPGGAADPLQLSPPLSPAGKVYLAYRLEANARASAGAGVGFFGASGDTERSVKLSDYHGHAPTELVRDAFLADAFKLRNILRANDVAGLAVGDALAMSTSGRLSTSVAVSWGDLLPAAIGRLSQLLPGVDHLIAVQTNLGASLHADASIQDDFVLVLSRPEPGRLRASVLRGETCTAGMGGALSAGVAFDPSAPVEAVLGALAGRPLKWVDDTMARLVQAPLDDATRGLLKLVLDRVGLAGGEADPAGLMERWGALKERLRGQLQEFITLRISAGLTYDFQRTEQRTALFQAVLPDADALAQHATLLRGDLTSLLQLLSTSGRAPEVYLRQQSVERRHAWGFSLGLPFISGPSSTDEDRLRFVTTTRQDGQKRLAALGARNYRGDLFGIATDWGAELHAEMAEFRAAPKASDFQYGLHLLMHREEKGSGALAQMVDDAVVWGAIDESDRLAVLQQIQAKAGNGGVDARVELTVTDTGLRALLPAAPAAGQAVLARVLARAMPWYGWRARQNADVRAAVYAPLWEGLLRDGGWAAKAAAAAAASALERNPMAKDIAPMEGQWPTPGLLTFASLVNAYPTVAATAQRMLAGLQALAGTIGSTMPADAIDAAFEQLKGGWGQSFLLRAFGALVVSLAGQRGAMKQLERTFTVNLPDADALLTFTTSK